MRWINLAEYAEDPEGMFAEPALGERYWEALGVPRDLLIHAIRDAANSDFLGGTQPEEWSPLGDVRPEWLANWEGLDSIFEEPVTGDGAEPPPDLERTIFNQDMTRGPVIGYLADGLGVGAIGVSWDSFLAPLPESATSLEIRFDEDASPDRMPSAADVLNAAPLGELDGVIYWRIYTGENSKVWDFVTSAKDGAHRLVRKGLRGGAVVVGRILRISAGRADSTKGDPLARRRRLEAELTNRDVADACPDIDDDVTTRSTAIVVVHGTMSTGLALAHAAVAASPAGCAVLRYEHDTWLPLERNAADLANLIGLRVTGSVLLIAHSRGGLVATRAAQILSDRHKSKPGLVGGVITLGTPFRGTPLAMGASVAAATARALMGGLRMIGGPVVDAGTRLLPIAVRFDTPPGIGVMRPTAGELPMLRQYMFTGTKVIAGDATTGPQDAYGPLSLGVGQGAFRDEAHDLVVGVESALGDRSDGIEVTCDHYSYLLEATVTNAMRDYIAAWAGRDAGNELSW
jgi:pimeloyl-ACP methyl ester carboxylesterase